MAQTKATHITWHDHRVPADRRREVKGHYGVVVWFTGLSGSGKSTLANALDCMLHERGYHSYVLDGDNIRHGLNRDLGFSPEDRHENIRRIGEVAHLMADAGLITITAFISPYIEDRNMARDLNPGGRFVEVFCACPLDVCEKRDPKGLYKKARAGEIKEFTGIDAPYEIPPGAEVVVHTDTESVAESAANVIRHLEKAGMVPTAGTPL
ncbi:MAG: adenylyl-sulfate kinase [Lentisphaerae bacterium]|nr:adenylyl-sulfate kinase [Lentisphaerota bacterium]